MTDVFISPATADLLARISEDPCRACGAKTYRPTIEHCRHCQEGGDHLHAPCGLCGYVRIYPTISDAVTVERPAAPAKKGRGRG